MSELKSQIDKLPGILLSARPDQIDVQRFSAMAKEGQIDLTTIATLLRYHEQVLDELVEEATSTNLERYRREIEFYAVCYISDFCVNSCRYCGLQNRMKQSRTQLDHEGLKMEFEAVLHRGPTDLCILTGEHPCVTTDYLALAANIATEADVHKALDHITFNVAPMKVEDFKRLKKAVRFPTLQYRIFQESYDPETYSEMHPSGPKTDYEFRLDAQERALQADIDRVGIGTLLGLNSRNEPYKHFGNDFEILALVTHARHLRKIFGRDPYSLSIPRHQPFPGHDFSTPNPVGDKRYLAYHALLRLALPNTKIVLTNRETEELRNKFRPLINIEDLAARPEVGGNSRNDTGLIQNEVNDSRGVEEIVEDLKTRGFFPILGQKRR